MMFFLKSYLLLSELIGIGFQSKNSHTVNSFYSDRNFSGIPDISLEVCESKCTPMKTKMEAEYLPGVGKVVSSIHLIFLFKHACDTVVLIILLL